MQGFLFINGQIRARESRLLTVGRLDRMIGAKTPEEAFRVLLELQYAEYVDENASPKDFNPIIERGLQETKDLIITGTDGHLGLQFLWKSEDLNNLKRAYKLKFLENKEELGEFTEENGFSTLGDFSHEDIQQIVFAEKTPEHVPALYAGVFKKVNEVFEDKKEFRFVEFLLDQAHFDYLAQIAKKTGVAFLQNWLELRIDMVNLRSLVRSLLMREETLSSDAFVTGGTIAWEEIAKVQTFGDFSDFVKHTRLTDVRSLLHENDSDEDKLIKIERECDRIENEFLHDAQSGEINSIQVPLAYFQRRMQNARMLKFVMFAKFHGLSPEEILKTLKHF